MVREVWESTYRRGFVFCSGGNFIFFALFSTFPSLISPVLRIKSMMFRFYHDFFEMEDWVDHWDLKKKIKENQIRLEIVPVDEDEKTIVDSFQREFFQDGHVMNGVNRVIDYERERTRQSMTRDPRFYLETELYSRNPTVIKIREAKAIFSDFGFPPRFFEGWFFCAQNK